MSDVPNVVGFPLKEAVSRLRSQGIEVAEVITTKAPSSTTEGEELRVLRQKSRDGGVVLTVSWFKKHIW